MAHVKTAISIDQALFDAANALAKQLHTSRSQLFAMAMETFIRQRQNQQFLEQIEEAYGDGPDPAEQAYLRRMKRQHRDRIEADEAW